MDYYNPDIVSAQDYYPFGMMMVGRIFGIDLCRYGFNDKEMDNEISGVGNQLNYGARIYDTRLGRWLSVDPLQTKYPGLSPYNAFANNPSIFVDSDGKDIVFFNNKGDEIFRIPSSNRFETYVQANIKAEALHSIPGIKGFIDKPIESFEKFAKFLFSDFNKVPMPKVLTEKLLNKKDKNENWKIEKGLDAPEYQKYDYQIAATAYLFNQTKNTTQYYTEGGNPIPISENDKIPDLDPTLLKIIGLQESNLGKTSKDVMSINNKGDLPKGNSYKKSYGITKNSLYHGAASIKMAPNFLVTKGFRGGIKNGIYTWTGGTDYLNAAKEYNGGGVENYLESVQHTLRTSREPIAADYKVPDSQQKK